MSKLYAGVLRAMGIKIEADVPDCAWIPAGSIEFKHGSPEIPAEATSRDRHLIDVKASMEFTEPWRWIEINGTIDLNDLENNQIGENEK